MDARYAQAYPDLYRRHWWWRVREEILIRRIAALRDGQKGARILDVGCGAGLFFDALERFGEVEGIESDADTVGHGALLGWADKVRRARSVAAQQRRTGSVDAGARPER